MCIIKYISSHPLKAIYMKALLGMAVAVALGVVLATFVQKWMSKTSTTTTA